MTINVKKMKKIPGFVKKMLKLVMLKSSQPFHHLNFVVTNYQTLDLVPSNLGPEMLKRGQFSKKLEKNSENQYKFACFLFGSPIHIAIKMVRKEVVLRKTFIIFN